MDNKVINEDGNKDEIFTKHGRNVFSPKILDRSSLTHLCKNTGQGTSMMGIVYGNPNVPRGSFQTQMDRFPNLDENIKVFCAPVALGMKHGRKFTIYSKEIQKTAREQRSRALKSGSVRKKKRSSLRKILESLQSSSGSAIFTTKKIDNEPPTEQNSQKIPRLKLSDETSEFCKQLSYGTKKVKKEKKKARP